MLYWLKEEISAINTRLLYFVLSKQERLEIKSLKGDVSFVTDTDKRLGVAVWDRIYYLKEAQIKWE